MRVIVPGPMPGLVCGCGRVNRGWVLPKSPGSGLRSIFGDTYTVRAPDWTVIRFSLRSIFPVSSKPSLRMIRSSADAPRKPQESTNTQAFRPKREPLIHNPTDWKKISPEEFYEKGGGARFFRENLSFSHF